MKAEKPKRTLKQNKALHLYFQLVAETLNDVGLDMRKALKPEIDIPWSKDSIKEYLWRPIQTAQLQKRSTTELTTRDVNIIYDTLNRFLAQKLGVHTPFPTLEEIERKIK